MECQNQIDLQKKTVQIYPPPSDLISDFWREKYEKDAKKYWDLFYKRNKDKFFKDRHYLHKEWGNYFERLAKLSCEDKGENIGGCILEVGCGVGNTVYPLRETYPNLFVYACDFSQRAVNIVKAHKDYNEKFVHAFVCDATCDDMSLVIPEGTIDIATLVFCLSAISPEKMPYVLQNIRKVLKPNGLVMIRDYAVGDLAQERFSAKIQKISQNFYVRGDGTRAFYFSESGMCELFRDQGFHCETIHICEKQVENRARELVMDRRWIQGTFRRTGATSVSTSNDAEEIDLSEGVGAELFGVPKSPKMEVMSINMGGYIFNVKSLSKEFQHSCKATGLILWESARVLATLIAENINTVSSKNVLELGCGSIGICSLIIAMEANAVVATDGDANALELLRVNVEANKHLIPVERLYIDVLQWGCIEHIKRIKDKTNGLGFDMIIGTDVTYVAEAVPLLFNTAAALIRDEILGKPEPILVLCHIERHVQEQAIFDAASRYGFVLEGKWPHYGETLQDVKFSEVIMSLFPNGLEVFDTYASVQLFCFKRRQL